MPEIRSESRGNPRFRTPQGRAKQGAFSCALSIHSRHSLFHQPDTHDGLPVRCREANRTEQKAIMQRRPACRGRDAPLEKCGIYTAAAAGSTIGSNMSAGGSPLSDVKEPGAAPENVPVSASLIAS